MDAIEGLEELVSLEGVMKQADILVALVAHRQFSRIPATHLTKKIVLDFCGIWR